MGARLPGRPKLDEARFAVVVTCEAPTLAVLAERFGISIAVASKLRTRLRRAGRL